MVYESLKRPLLLLLRAPHEPPQPPLGSAHSLQVEKPSARYLTMQLIVHFASIGAALVFELIAWRLSPTPAPTAAMAFVSGGIVVITVLVMLLRYFLIRLDYDMRFYLLTDRSLRIRRGALAIEESTYTFANVQNLSLEQGPLERLLKLAHLHIETAGGGAQSRSASSSEGMFHKGRLEGLDFDKAVELRDEILRLVRTYADSGLGERASRAASPGVPASELQARAEVLQALVDEFRDINAAARRLRTEHGARPRP